jgi:hypothetical protein
MLNGNRLYSSRFLIVTCIRRSVSQSAWIATGDYYYGVSIGLEPTRGVRLRQLSNVTFFEVAAM